MKPSVSHTAMTYKSPETWASLPSHIPGPGITWRCFWFQIWGNQCSLFGYCLPGCLGLHPSGCTVQKEPNTRARHLVKSKEIEFLTNNRNCITNVSVLLSCAAGMRAPSCKVVLCCQSQQLSPSELPQMFSFWEGAEHWEEQAEFPLPKLANKDLDKDGGFYRKAINLLLFQK